MKDIPVYKFRPTTVVVGLNLYTGKSFIQLFLIRLHGYSCNVYQVAKG